MKKAKNPKKTRRSNIKHPGLDKKYTTRIRQEFLDFDYIDQLDDNAKEWLNKFVEEELNSKFENDGSDFNQTKNERKKIYDRNNAQNRDLYGNLKNKDNKFQNKKLLNYDNIVADVENEFSKSINPENIEDAYIDYLDHKQMQEMLIEYNLAMLNFNAGEESPE